MLHLLTPPLATLIFTVSKGDENLTNFHVDIAAYLPLNAKTGNYEVSGFMPLKAG